MLRQNGRRFPDNILNCIFLNKNVWILLRFHWSLFPRFEFTIFQHCADQATGHYLKQCWPSSPMHICITQPQLVKSWWNRTKIDLKKIWKICCLWCEIRNIYLFMTLLKRPLSHSVDPGRFDSNLKVEYLIICIICDTDLVNKLILQMYTLHKYK